METAVRLPLLPAKNGLSSKDVESAINQPPTSLIISLLNVSRALAEPLGVPMVEIVRQLKQFSNRSRALTPRGVYQRETRYSSAYITRRPEPYSRILAPS